MKNIRVVSLNKSHEHPEEYIANLVSLTFSKKLNSSPKVEDIILNHDGAKLDTLKNVIEMEHLGMLEHVDVSYLIQGASRSLLAQLTRHRLFSFVSASQQYMDYSNFADFVVPVELEGQDPELIREYLEANKKSLEEYKSLIAKGIHHEVARQLLPNSMRNNLIVKGNLREWFHFFNQRLCGRNTSEILYIAYLIRQDLKEYVPTISEYMVPDCILRGHCTQKHLCCGNVYSDEACEERFKVLCKSREEQGGIQI